MSAQSSIYYNTMRPYKVLAHKGIVYTTCREFTHISRYKGLRQVIHHYVNSDGTYVTLEIPSPLYTNVEFMYYDVPASEENRLDIIAYKFYGSAQYSWIISYFNSIADGYTVFSGQRLKIIKNFTQLFNKGEILSSIPGMQLQLGTE